MILRKNRMKLLAFVTLLALSSLVYARKHSVSVRNDPRFAFLVGSFGFLKNGELKLKLHSFDSIPAEEGGKSGFVIFRTLNMLDSSDEVDYIVAERLCDFTPVKKENIVETLIPTQK